MRDQSAERGGLDDEGAHVVTWSEPIRFFPDGRCDPARLTLAGEKYDVAVTLRRLTGQALVAGLARRSRTPVGPERRHESRGHRLGRVSVTGGSGANGMNCRTPRTHGFSLLEVILALAIFVGSAIAMSHLVNTGRLHQERSALLTDAQRLAFDKMNEYAAGLTAEPGEDYVPFRNEPDWSYAISVVSVPLNGLRAVQISVVPTTEVDFLRSEHPVFRLVRWFDAELDESEGAGAFGMDDASAGLEPFRSDRSLEGLP